MPIKQTQFRFTAGELDPKLIGRTDVDKYYSAVEEATNVDTNIQGGFSRSNGLRFLKKAPRKLNRELSPLIIASQGGNIANINDNDINTTLVTTFPIGTINQYVVIFYDLGVSKQIKFVDIANCSLTSQTNNADFFIQGSIDNAIWENIGDAIDMSPEPVTRRKEVDKEYRYLRFVKINNTNLLTDVVTIGEFSVFTEESELSNIKFIPFEFDINETYMLVLSDKNIQVYYNNIFQVNVRSTKIINDIIPFIDYTQSADNIFLSQQNMYPQKIVRQNADDKWFVSDIVFDYIPKYDFNSSTTNPSGTITPSETSGIIELDTSDNTFSIASVGQYIEGKGGRARILEYITQKKVQAVTEIPFYSTDQIEFGDWSYITGYEDVWSETRGYPRKITFHEGRLWFGGSLSRPQTIWGSKINLFFDFNLGSLFDSDGLDLTLDSGTLNTIVNLKSSNGNLLIFTTGSEFIATGNTSSDIRIVPVSEFGSENGFQLGIIDTHNIFIQRGGRSIIKYTYDTLQQVTGFENISSLSGHLIKDPLDFAIRKSTSLDSADSILFIDGENRLIRGNVSFTQEVVGFTKRNTISGKFKNVGVDLATIYCCVEREINGNIDNYIEYITNDGLLDSSKKYDLTTPTNIFTGLDHLENQTVKIIADGAVLSDEIVVNGSVTIDSDAQEYCEIGLDLKPVVVTLPIEDISGSLGSVMGKKKRINGVVLRLNETRDFTINNQKVSFRTTGSPPPVLTPKFTGDKRIQGLLGWNIRQKITISQDQPVELEVLTVTMNWNI
jgi:hypothetical protein